MARPAAVFVITMTAVAGPANSQPDGRRYDLLVFARAETEAQAETAAARGVDQLGWIDLVWLRTGEITDPDAIPDDLRGSYQRALEGGCAVIAYDEP
jgi:hypothetical protein